MRMERPAEPTSGQIYAESYWYLDIQSAIKQPEQCDIGLMAYMLDNEEFFLFLFFYHRPEE